MVKKTTRVKGETRATWREKKSDERGKVMTIILGVGQSASGVQCQRLLFIWGGQGANVCAGAVTRPQIASAISGPCTVEGSPGKLVNPVSQI